MPALAEDGLVIPWRLILLFMLVFRALKDMLTSYNASCLFIGIVSGCNLLTLLLE